MLLRVRIVPRHWEAVHDDLASREAALLEEQARPRVCVLRAEAPLRKLLGYGEALAKLNEERRCTGSGSTATPQWAIRRAA